MLDLPLVPPEPRSSGWVRRIALAGVTLALTTTGLVATAPPAAAEPECLSPSSDFDGDRIPDPVIGAPGGPTGSVQVRLTGEGDPRVVTVAAPAGARGFGSAVGSLSSYENEGDDQLCSQLVVGAPGETVGGRASAGAVYVFTWNGTAFTLRSRYAPGVNGVPGAAQAEARFGASVSAALHADDGFAEPTRLYVGAPGQTVGGITGAGSVTSFLVGASGPAATAGRVVSYATTGVPGAPTRGGGLGTSLSATGSVVAAGAPGQTAGGVVGAGEVLLLSDASISPFAPVQLSQASPGVPGTAERGDRFGAAVHLAENAATRRYQLMVGAPGEDLGSSTDAGTVDLIRLAWDDPADRTATAYGQDLPEVAGTAETGDGFGSAVSAHRDASGGLTYLVGTPGEDISAVGDAGMVQVVGRTTNPSWTQNSAGVPGAVEAGDAMGATLSDSIALTGPIVGVPGEDAGAGAVLSGLPAFSGSVQFWQAVPSVTGGRFGAAVAP